MAQFYAAARSARFRRLGSGIGSEFVHPSGCIGVAAGLELHDSFSGSQLEAAVAFLRAHRGKVSPITLTVWGNDINEFIEACRGDLSCVQAGAPTFILNFSRRLADILSQLREASPDAEIIVT
jgi:hypothetical protein